MNRHIKDKELLVDKWIHNLTERQLQMIGLVILLLLSVMIRFHLAPFCDLSPDYHTFYANWVGQYRHMGMRRGLSQTIGDYYVPINMIYAMISFFPWKPWVLIAAVSCAFEYITVYFLYRMVVFLITGKTRGVKLQMKAAYASVAILFLPCSMWNSSLWKQCDSIYTCFAVIAVYFLLQDQYRKAVILLGISLSFKLQAVLLLPFFVCIYLIKRKFSVIHFAWLPVVYLIAGLPAVLLHRGLRATYFTYLGQMREGTSESYGLNSYFPNIYALGLDKFYRELCHPAILLMIAIIVVMILYVYHYRDHLTQSKMLLFAIMSAWTCCMFLPCMHERYDYMVILMLTVYACAVDRKMLIPAILANFCSMLTYTIVLFHTATIPLMVISCIYIAAYLIGGYRLVEQLKTQNDKEGVEPI